MKLPEPDPYGNYWLREGPGRVQGPCILHGKIDKRNNKQRWFASAGRDGGVVFAGPELAYFDTPEKALKVLEALCQQRQVALH